MEKGHLWKLGGLSVFCMLTFPLCSFGQIPAHSCYILQKSLMCGHQIYIQNDSIAILDVGCDRSGIYVYAQYSIGENSEVTFLPVDRSTLPEVITPVYGSDTLKPANRIVFSDWDNRETGYKPEYHPMSENNPTACYTLGLPVSEVIPAEQNGKFLSHVKVNLPGLYYLYTDKRYASNPEEAIASFSGMTFTGGTFVRKSQQRGVKDEVFTKGGVER